MFSFDDECEDVVWLQAEYIRECCGCEYRFRFRENILAGDPKEALLARKATAR